MQHIYTGAGAPSATPSGVGHHYVDIQNRKTYISVGTANVSDWLQVGGASVTPKKESFEIKNSDIVHQYLDLSDIALAQSVMMSSDRQTFYEGPDYTVSWYDSKTRLTFTPGGKIAAGGSEAFEIGQLVYISYLV